MSKIIIEIEDGKNDESTMVCDMVICTCAKKDGEIIGVKTVISGFNELLDLYRVNQSLNKNVYEIGFSTIYEDVSGNKFKRAIELSNQI